MKTHALVVAAVALGGWQGAPVSAQGLGLGGGLNLAKLTGQEQTLIRSEQRKGLNLGGTLSFPFGRWVMIQPEVYYAQKGEQQESTQAAATLALDYVEVPVLAKINLPGTSFLQPQIAAGPAFAWNVRCDLSIDDGTGTPIPVENGSCAQNPSGVKFGKADRGLVVGGGVRLALGGVGLILETRLVRGLKRLEEEQPTTGSGTKNQAVSFLARFSFAGR